MDQLSKYFPNPNLQNVALQLIQDHGSRFPALRAIPQTKSRASSSPRGF